MIKLINQYLKYMVLTFIISQMYTLMEIYQFRCEFPQPKHGIITFGC